MFIRITFVALLLSLLPTLRAQAAFEFAADQGGMSIRVGAANAGSLTTVNLMVQHEGELILRAAVPADGTVTGASVGDLNRDGYPEVYVFITSAGSGSYGSIIAYASNRNQSMTPVTMQDLPDDAAVLAGYLGHDRYELGDDVLLRSFPVYLPGNSNADPQGGRRTLRYRLHAGEAGWLLKPELTVSP